MQLVSVLVCSKSLLGWQQPVAQLALTALPLQALMPLRLSPWAPPAPPAPLLCCSPAQHLIPASRLTPTPLRGQLRGWHGQPCRWPLLDAVLLLSLCPSRVLLLSLCPSRALRVQNTAHSRLAGRPPSSPRSCLRKAADVARFVVLLLLADFGGWVGGVTTKPTAAEHMYSVASQEERRKEKSVLVGTSWQPSASPFGYFTDGATR
jgi:hypothetical protein